MEHSVTQIGKILWLLSNQYVNFIPVIKKEEKLNVNEISFKESNARIWEAKHIA